MTVNSANEPQTGVPAKGVRIRSRHSGPTPPYLSTQITSRLSRGGAGWLFFGVVLAEEGGDGGVGLPGQDRANDAREEDDALNRGSSSFVEVLIYRSPP
jgi:hypothetical protein